MSVARGATGWLGVWAAASLLCLATPTQPAWANADVCRQLESELASARSGGDGSTLYRKYDRAVAAQLEQIALARRQARDSGCGFSAVGGRSRCGVLGEKIGKMQHNLAALQRRRAQLALGRSSPGNRLRILAALDANGCRSEELVGSQSNRGDQPRDDGSSPVGRHAPGDGKVVGEAAGGLAASRSSMEASEGHAPDSEEHIVIGRAAGEFRTFCMRTCDGYFFPLSDASSAMDLDRDQSNCDALCPGTEMRLYLHRSTDEPESMVSASTGAPYTAHPNAYLYKADGMPRPGRCGCNPAKNFSVIAGAPRQDKPAATVSTTAGSILRLDEMPRGNAAEAGDSSTETAPPSEEAAPHATGERRVRAVGPAFLPDPEAAIDLRAPARKTVR